MDTITIKAEPREPGKKGTKAVRREGNVPCILYGHHAEPVAFQVPELSLRPLIYTADRNLVRIEIGGTAYECVMKEADFHPVTDRPIHADFLVLEQGEELTLSVPVQFHGVPRGQKEGGDTQYSVHELEVRCLPKHIPSHIDVAIDNLGIGDSIHVGDLDIPGVVFTSAADQTLVTVVPPRGLEATEEAEETLLAGEQVDTDEDEGGETPVEQTEA